MIRYTNIILLLIITEMLGFFTYSTDKKINIRYRNSLINALKKYKRRNLYHLLICDEDTYLKLKGTPQSYNKCIIDHTGINIDSIQYIYGFYETRGQLHIFYISSDFTFENNIRDGSITSTYYENKCRNENYENFNNFNLSGIQYNKAPIICKEGFRWTRTKNYISECPDTDEINSKIYLNDEYILSESWKIEDPILPCVKDCTASDKFLSDNHLYIYQRSEVKYLKCNNQFIQNVDIKCRLHLGIYTWMIHNIPLKTYQNTNTDPICIPKTCDPLTSETIQNNAEGVKSVVLQGSCNNIIYNSTCDYKCNINGSEKVPNNEVTCTMTVTGQMEWDGAAYCQCSENYQMNPTGKCIACITNYKIFDPSTKRCKYVCDLKLILSDPLSDDIKIQKHYQALENYDNKLFLNPCKENAILHNSNGITCSYVALRNDGVLHEKEWRGWTKCECMPTFTFDSVTNTCICNKLLVEDEKNKICRQPCDSKQIYNSDTQTCDCKEGYTKNTTTDVCECSSGTILNSQLDKCLPCEQNQKYNELNKSCDCKPEYFTLLTSKKCQKKCNLANILSDQLSNSKIINSWYSTSENYSKFLKSPCKQNATIINPLGIKCIPSEGSEISKIIGWSKCECIQGFQYNPDKNECYCPDGKVYKKEKNECYACSGNKVYNKEKNECKVYNQRYNFVMLILIGITVFFLLVLLIYWFIIYLVNRFRKERHKSTLYLYTETETDSTAEIDDVTIFVQ